MTIHFSWWKVEFHIPQLCTTPGRLAPLQEAVAAAAAAARGVRKALKEDIEAALKGRRWGPGSSMVFTLEV